MFLRIFAFIGLVFLSRSFAADTPNEISFFQDNKPVKTFKKSELRQGEVLVGKILLTCENKSCKLMIRDFKAS